MQNAGSKDYGQFKLTMTPLLPLAVQFNNQQKVLYVFNIPFLKKFKKLKL